jgi:hypothetical protein
VGYCNPIRPGLAVPRVAVDMIGHNSFVQNVFDLDLHDSSHRQSFPQFHFATHHVAMAMEPLSMSSYSRATRHAPSALSLFLIDENSD